MILNKYIEDNIFFNKVTDMFCFVKNKISFKNIFFIVISILLANQTFITQISPFTYVIYAVASLFDVPLILVLISSGISMCVGQAQSELLISSISFFVAFTLITSLLNIEGVSKKYVVYIKFIIAYAIIETIFSIINGVFFINLFQNIGNLLIVSILYFIFATGIYVILNKANKLVYSKEESVSMVIVLCLVMTVFNKVNIYTFSLANILIMMIILIYGWKNGPITACSAGIISGLLISCMSDIDLIYVLTLGLAGIFAGVFKKFGKLGIILAFIIGNVYIAYFTNNFSDIVLRILEMLIASIGILFIPKKLEVKFDDLFNKNKTLVKPYDNMLDSASNLKEKIGAISEVFENLANIKIEESQEDKIETREVIKKYIQNYINQNCIVCPKKGLCADEEKLEITSDYIASKLEKNEVITRDMLGFDCNNSDKMVTDLQEVYNSMKLMRMLKQKEKENSEKVSKQYRHISSILNNISNSIDKKKKDYDKVHKKLRDELKIYGYTIYEDDFKRDKNDIEYTFVTDILSNIDNQKKEITSLASNILEQNVSIKLILNSSKKEKSKIKIVTIPNYSVKTSIISEKKSGCDISGDSYLSMELSDLKQVNIISDGAGSGKTANKSSQTVINLIEKLISSGFDEESAVNIINSFIKLKGNDTVFSTLDAFIMDLRTAKAQFIKLGAAPTYILRKNKVTTISNMTIPLGLINESDYIPIVCNLDVDNIIIQITDGVISDDYDYNNNYITKYLQALDNTKSVKVISDEIKKLILKEKKNIIDDDFTVIVTKVVKNNNK